jgi:hypothetical protein
LPFGSSVAAVAVSDEALRWLVSGFADSAPGAPSGVIADVARLLPEGEPVDVADFGCVFRGEAVIGRFGPRCWVGLDADEDVPVVEDVEVAFVGAADAESSAAATPCPVATAATSHADTAMPPYRPT